jgi:hypothetical protein
MPDRLIRITTALVVVGVAVVSYEHAYALVRAHGEDGWTARLVPTVPTGLASGLSGSSRRSSTQPWHRARTEGPYPQEWGCHS